MEIKNLQAKDLMLAGTIISKLGLGEIKAAFAPEVIKELTKDGEVNLEKIGISVALDMAGIVLGNLQKCDKEIYQLLSNVTEMTPKEVAEMDAVEFAELIVDIVKNPRNKGFFNLASRFRNSEK